MGRAARKDAAEDASWRRLPQRVFWRFYPAFEGLFVAARSAVVFLAVGNPPCLSLRATIELRRAPALPRSGLSEARPFSTISGPSHGNADPFSRNSGRLPPIVSRNAGPNRPRISGPGTDDLRPLHL